MVYFTKISTISRKQIGLLYYIRICFNHNTFFEKSHCCPHNNLIFACSMTIEFQINYRCPLLNTPVIHCVFTNIYEQNPTGIDKK